MNASTAIDASVCYFLVAATVYYTKDDALKERTINVIMDSAAPNLPKKALNNIQQAVMSRIKAENGVTPEMVKDVVILNIVLMGVMSPELFHGELSDGFEADEAETAH